MNTIVERTLMLTPATGSVIELAEGDEMVYQATSGTLAAYIGFRLKREGSMSGRCIEAGTVMVSNDTELDPLVNREACRKVGARSMVVVPLIQRGAVVGILKAASTIPSGFTQLDIQTILLMAGLLGGALGQQLEIERRQKMEEQLRHMALNDALTNLPNRVLFKDRLAPAIQTNKRNKSTLAMMYLDIDYFKSINDVHGRAEGDALLRQFAARISGILRGGDTLARLGGDEFALISENLKSPADAEAVATQIVQAMKQPFQLQNVSLNIGVSIGVAVSAKPDIQPDTLVERADQALYEAKRAVRNCFKIVEM